MINEKSNDNLFETVFPKKNKWKDLVNAMDDRELAVGNTSKCREEKTKGEKGKNAAVNLTTENQKEQKGCVDMKRNLRNLLNFPKIFYPTIL